MGSTFSGLSVASSALAAQRRAIQTAGHNVANANTPGYSRQRVELGAIPGGSFGFHSGASATGGGVEVLSQQRIVDQFLVTRANIEHSRLGYAAELQGTYASIEAIFDEPGDQGRATQLQDYGAAWDPVAATPEDAAARAALLQRGEAIADTFGDLTRQLEGIAENARERAQATTIEINALSSQIADLNSAIHTAGTSSGTPPNDLLDQRDRLVAQLSDHIGVRTTLRDDGMISVTAGNVALVSGTRAAQVELDISSATNISLREVASGSPVNPTGGAILGMIETVNTVVPDTQAQLDALALQLRDVVNAQHLAGQDLDGNAGGAFFTATGAADLALDPGVAGNPRAVAAAAAGAGLLDGENALAMAELSGLTGGPDDEYRSLIAGLGVAAQTANRRHDLQSEMTSRADAAKEEVSGVSIDEEMTNMVAFQQAYQAAARFMTTIDEMLNTLINGTGVVGR